MSDEELKKFVIDFVDNKIFISGFIPVEEAKHIIHAVFMPLIGITFSKKATKSLAQLWEYYAKAGPRSINGYPMFWSVRMISIADWKRAKPAIDKLMEKRKAEKEELEV